MSLEMLSSMVDGCALLGTPETSDGTIRMDEITNYVVQLEVYDRVDDAIRYVERIIEINNPPEPGSGL